MARYQPQYKDIDGTIKDLPIDVSSVPNVYKVNDSVTTTGSTNGVYIVNNDLLPSELYDGLTIRVCLARTYNSTANSLNLNGTGDKIMWFRYGTRLTSHYAQWSILTITYKTTATGSAYTVPASPARSTSGTSITDGWVVENIYDSNTTSTLQETNKYSIQGKDIRLNGYGLFGYDKDGIVQSFGAYGNGESTAIRTVAQNDRKINSNGIDWARGIFYSNTSADYPVSPNPTRVEPIRNWAASTAYVIGDYILNTNAIYICKTAHTSASSFSSTEAANFTLLYYILNCSPCEAVSGIDFRYTFNCIASSDKANYTLGLRLGKDIYLRGYLKNNLFYFAPTTVKYNNNDYLKAWTQDIPTQEEYQTVDGVNYPIVYWLCGYAYYNSTYIPNLYQVTLYQDNPLYWYKDGEFKLYNTVQDWAKAATKPTYTASEVGARPSTWTPTKSDIGLGNVGNFKAVSTVASQGLTDTEKSNARANIGAGTSSLTLGTTSTTAAYGNHNHDGTYLKSITSSDVTTALGYTPYNATNPNGYTSNKGTVTSVNNTSPDANGNVSITIPSAVTESTVSGWGFTKNTGTYSKPSGGIPKTDLASAVQTSLDKADKAVIVNDSGVSEVGQYMDFHYDKSTDDYSTRLQCDGNHKNTVNLPYNSGTLALKSDIPTLKSIHIHNIFVQGTTTNNYSYILSIMIIEAGTSATTINNMTTLINWLKSNAFTAWDQIHPSSGQCNGYTDVTGIFTNNNSLYILTKGTSTSANYATLQCNSTTTQFKQTVRTITL